METRKKSSKRQMTICSKAFERVGGYVQFPIIILSGKWLRESGFKIGQVIDIHYHSGKLTITIAQEQRFDLQE